MVILNVTTVGQVGPGDRAAHLIVQCMAPLVRNGTSIACAITGLAHHAIKAKRNLRVPFCMNTERYCWSTSKLPALPKQDKES